MLKNFTRILLAGILTLSFQGVGASPANPNPVKIQQPDGSEITVRLMGDERIKWMESTDGYSLLYGKDKYIVYAIENDKGDMVPSDVTAKETSLRSTETAGFLSNIKKGLRYSPSQIETLRRMSKIVSSGPTLRSATGNAKAICALIGFPDKPFSHTVQEFEQLMNQIGYSSNGAKGSVRDYYREVSYDKLDLVVTVVGPFTAAKAWKYYGENDATGEDKHSKELAVEVANFTFKSPSVNPANFDNDNNGTIDAFHFFYAGYGEEAGGPADCIWAQKGSFDKVLTFGDKQLENYSCSPELRGNSGNSITNIGIPCHELCHIFGAPDYYDTDNAENGQYIGTGKWDLMGTGNWNEGGITPAHINMYQKIAFGWVNPTELTAETQVTGMKNAVENPVAYKIQTSTPGEFFILENRQRVKFDAGIPGHGLLIYRIHSQVSGDNVNNSTHPQQVYPVCASSLYSIPNVTPASYGNINSAECPFPGTSGKTAFTDYTTPSAKSWKGNNTSKPVTDITETNGEIAFRFMKSGPVVSNVKTSVNGQDVTVSWDLPSGAVPDGYAIYRNGQSIVILSNGSIQNYTQYRVSAGNYDYCVAPIYGISESAQVCASATVGGTTINCPPVNNLTARENGGSIELNWKSDHNNVWIAQCGEMNDGIIGYNENNYAIISRFATDDLKYSYGLTLTKVKAYIDNTSVKYTIKIWTPAKNTLPENIIVSQVLSPEKTGIIDFKLDNPVKLESDRELWIGLYFEQTGEPAAIVAKDSGPKKDNVNLILIDNELYEAPGDYNFYLKGFLEYKGTTKSLIDDSSELRATNDFERYRIYKNGQFLGTTGNEFYADQNTTPGSYVYSVSTMYSGCESEQTAVFTSIGNPYGPVTNLTAGTNENSVSLNWTVPAGSAGLSGYKIYRDGQAVGTTTSNTYTETVPESKEYTYAVTALYGAGESVKTEVKVFVVITGIEQIQKNSIVRVFPNPVERGHVMTIDLGQEDHQANVMIYTISGQLVDTQQISGQTGQINADLAPGTYLMKIKTNSKLTTHKIVIK